MTTFSDLVNDVLLLMEGYGLDQGRVAFITGSTLTATGTTFTVDSTTNIGPGVAEIEDELVYVQSVNDGTSTVTISPDGRGYRGTKAVPHAAGKRVTMNPVLPRTLVKRKINETLTGVYPTLFGQATTSISYNPMVAAYPMPSDMEDITQITVQDIGPSRVWAPVRRWNVDRSPDTTAFPTGKVLNIWDDLYGETNVRVVYQKQPSELSYDTDDLTDSGLASTARACVVAGAAWRLVSFMDASRLKVNASTADTTSDKNPIGTATQVGSYLRKQYEQELQDEQTRQQLATPPIIYFQE